VMHEAEATHTLVDGRLAGSDQTLKKRGAHG